MRAFISLAFVSQSLSIFAYAYVDKARVSVRSNCDVLGHDGFVQKDMKIFIVPLRALPLIPASKYAHFHTETLTSL